MPKLSSPESYELARMSMDMVSDMVLWLDSSSRFFLVNQAACDLLGYSNEELLNMSVHDIDMGHPKEVWEEHWEDIKTEKSQLIISTYRKRNGNTIPVEIHAHIINFNNEKYACSTVRDIADRKNFELALSEKEEKYQKTFHQVPSAVYLSSLPEGRLIEVNKSFETISGYSREELIGKTVEELNFYINPEDRVLLLEKLQKDGKLEGYEISYRIKSGESRLCIGDAEPILIAGKQHLVGVITDITDQKKAELELRESEEKYRLLIENIPDVVWSSDGSGNTNFISANVEKVYGYGPDEILSSGSKLWFDRIHEEDKSLVELSFSELLKDGNPYDLEYRIKRKDGEWIWLRDRALITYQEEEKLYAYGVFSDITRRKIFETALQESEGKFRQLINNIDEVFWIVTPDWKDVIYISPAYEKVWGKSMESLLENGRSWTDSILEEDRQQVVSIIQNPETGDDLVTFPDYRIVKPEGEVLWIRARGYIVRDESGNISRIAGIAEDITIRRKTEELTQVLVGNTSGFTGEDYFRNLVNELSSSLDTDYVFIATPVDNDSGKVETIALSFRGKEIKNFAYVLEHTPCQTVFSEGFCFYQGDVQIRFPKDQQLVDLGINSYAGIALRDIQNQILGIMVVLNQTEFIEPEFIKNILQLSAVRAGAEIERTLSEKALKKSEASFKALLNATTEVAFLIDTKGKIGALNDSFSKQLGKDKESVVRTDAFSILDSEIADERRKQFKLVDETKAPVRFEDENRGEWFDNSIYPILGAEDQIIQYAVYSKNITERKQAEKELLVYQENLRSMAAELATVEDREKRTIAEYLHDHLGQSLALAKIKIGRTLRREPAPEIIDSLNDIESDITDAINYSQSVIYELSPPILYELGLLEALKWKMHDFEKKEGISTGLSIPEKISTMEQDTSIILFRSATELLNNVVKHAAASYVKLVVKEMKDTMIMSIEDNGIGFDYERSQADHSKDHKFGLFSIKERLKYYGGRIEIQSPEEGGSVISLFVPLK